MREKYFRFVARNVYVIAKREPAARQKASDANGTSATCMNWELRMQDATQAEEQGPWA